MDSGAGILNLPPFLDHEVVLSDKAFASVPHCLPPIKFHAAAAGAQHERSHQPVQDAEFNRCHQFFRARCEHCFAWLKSWGILQDRCRVHKTSQLWMAVQIISAIRNLYLVFNGAYLPYRPA